MKPSLLKVSKGFLHVLGEGTPGQEKKKHAASCGKLKSRAAVCFSFSWPMQSCGPEAETESQLLRVGALTPKFGRILESTRGGAMTSLALRLQQVSMAGNEGSPRAKGKKVI